MDSGLAREEGRKLAVELLDEELQVLSVKEEKLDPGGGPTLLCSVLTEKLYKKESLRAHLKSLWKTKEGFDFKEAGQNLQLIIFKSEEDMKTVERGSPWLFRRQLVLLKRLTKAIERKDVQLNRAFLRLRLVAFPPGSDKNDLIMKVSRSFEEAEVTEVAEKFCKIRVLVDIRRPLRRGTFVSVGGGEQQWIPFKYDNLPFHCFGCGRVGHTLRDCSRCSEEQKAKPEEEQPFNASLRAEAGIGGFSGFKAEDAFQAVFKQKNYLGEEEDIREDGKSGTPVEDEQLEAEKNQKFDEEVEIGGNSRVGRHALIEALEPEKRVDRLADKEGDVLMGDSEAVKLPEVEGEQVMRLVSSESLNCIDVGPGHVKPKESGTVGDKVTEENGPKCSGPSGSICEERACVKSKRSGPSWKRRAREGSANGVTNVNSAMHKKRGFEDVEGLNNESVPVLKKERRGDGVDGSNFSDSVSAGAVGGCSCRHQ